MDFANLGLESTRAISSSLYFWWIAFLRLSPDYWWICQQNGDCLDPRLVSLWQDFGDIYKYPTIGHWWIEHAAKLFDSPQQQLNFDPAAHHGLKLLDPTKYRDLIKDHVIIAIPNHFDTLMLPQKILTIFNAARVSGRHVTNDALYHLENRLNPVGVSNLIAYYCTYILKQFVEKANTDSPIYRWSSLQMAEHLKIAPQFLYTKGDSTITTKQKQKQTRSTHYHFYSTACNLITNSSAGKFPFFGKLSSDQKWRPDQLQNLERQIKNNQWFNEDWLDREHSFLFPENAIPTFGEGLYRVRGLRVIADLINMTPLEFHSK